MMLEPPVQIISLRHGETQWNRDGRIQGHMDSPLTLVGIGQMRAIAKTLRPHVQNLGAYQVWSSPLARTRQSISVFCEELGIDYGDVRFDDRLMERAYPGEKTYVLARTMYDALAMTPCDDPTGWALKQSWLWSDIANDAVNGRAAPFEVPARWMYLFSRSNPYY